MAITPRQVKNKRNISGALTGYPGTVYDVNIKYQVGNRSKTYAKRGFPTRKEAQQHEAEMRMKFLNPTYLPQALTQTKITLREYLTEWMENYGRTNLRPSTFAGYQNQIEKHILPDLGKVPLSQLSPVMLDHLFQKLLEQGLSTGTVKGTYRVLNVSLEHARKYHYIEHNPMKDVITTLNHKSQTPDPYTIEQMKILMEQVAGSNLELIVVLGGLYGLRISEIIGLRWHNVDLEQNLFRVVEQMPFRLPRDTKIITEMAPVKSQERVLPITEITRSYFTKQWELQQDQKSTANQYFPYYDNNLVIAKPDGRPKWRDLVSDTFKRSLKRWKLPTIRFHDLRHPYVKSTTKKFIFFVLTVSQKSLV